MYQWFICKDVHQMMLVIIPYCISQNISSVKHWWIDLKPSLVKKSVIWTCHSNKKTLKLENIDEQHQTIFTDMSIWCIDLVQFCTPKLVHVLVSQAGYCYSGFHQWTLFITRSRLLFYFLFRTHSIFFCTIYRLQMVLIIR